MSEVATTDMKALEQAFAQFVRTTQTMEEAYRRLEQRVQSLDQELAAKNRELELANDYVNGILESMSDGVIVVDPHDVITTFNRAASMVLGYSQEELLGHRFSEIFERPFLAGTSTAGRALRARSGRDVPVAERDSTVAGPRDARLGYVKVFQDLSELEALRQQLRQVDRLAAIGEMAATVAHEIRNPLGGIRGFAALLARDIPPEDPRARLVEKILAGTRNLERVVGELLEYTRPVDLRLKPVSCRELTESAIGLLPEEGRSEGIVIENEVDALIRALADPDKMRQVLLNMLLNAVQAIEGSGRVSIHAEAVDNEVRLAVCDTGCGIPDEQLTKVFSPFYTTKEKGTGLGLAAAAKIVEGHGGAIEVASQPGEGSIFTIRLPRAE